ncbi:hypothetical protein AB6A40_009588 [Gnathostoma spinigerum]|uniref:Uncharacterized protein n=1 Tax=Gnathostoma spinigerum TaxID=75299 RepID=A0ABD6EZU4_9BILA
MKSRDSDVPQRIEQLFSALYKGFSSFADLYRIEFNRLTLNKEGYYNNEIPSDTVGEEKLKTFEEAVKTYSELAEHVHDLRRQYEKLSGRHGAVNSGSVHV